MRMLKAVFFDLDGVLVDSYGITISYFQETLRHFGHPVPREKDFQGLLGLKTIDIARCLLPGISDEELHPIFEYSKEMSVKFTPKIPLAEGSVRLLTRLQKSYRLVIITNRGKKTLDVLCEKYHLRPFFEFLVDRDMITNHKPDPEGILLAMNTLGVNSSEVVYVGDMKEDVLAAHNARIACILLLSQHLDLAAREKTDYTISKLSELPALLKRLT